MKRLLVASVLAASLLASPAEMAYAGGSTSSAAQIQWTSAASATMSLVTQYSSAFGQGNGLPSLLQSVAGTCSPLTSELPFTLTFGAVASRSGTAVACLYQNAIAVSVQTNDASGFTVNEYIDVPLTNGVGICVYPNGGGGSFPETPAVAPITTSSQSGTPPAGSYTGSALTACPGAGRVLPEGAGGVSTNGTTAGNPGTPGLEFYSPSTAFLTMMSSSGPTVSGGSLVTMYGAEDVQINLGPGTKSMPPTLTGDFITFQLIPN